MDADAATAAGEALLKNPKFVEMFQKAMGDEKMPDEGDPKREAWLKSLQEKLAAQTAEESKKQVEQVVSDEDGEWMWIVPEVGFCVKAKTVAKNKKIFINVCKHPKIAEPIPIEGADDDPEMKDAIKYRIPLSCGAGRPDTDKQGSPCIVYDVVVNPSTIDRCKAENEFRRFVAALCMTWIKQKSEPDLDADQFTNVNFRCKGTPQMQRIRLGPPKKQGEQNAMSDEIKLPSNPAGGTAPARAASSSASGTSKPLVVELEPKEVSPSSTFRTEGNYDWSKHQQPTKNSFFREAVPETIEAEIVLPGISTIRELDVQLVGREVRFTGVDSDDGVPFYVCTLPFPVAETPLASKFVRATQTLRMKFAVALPDETEEEARRQKAHEAALAAETKEERAKRLKEEQEMKERRERVERVRREEEDVMRQRKELVDNMKAVEQGRLPPGLEEEITAMSPEQARGMLVRLENRVKRGDSIDQMLEKLPQDVLDNIMRTLRDKLGLAEPEAVRKAREERAKAEREAAAKRKAQSEPVVEYNFAKKAENLFGIKLENRYVFALEH